MRWKESWGREVGKLEECTGSLGISEFRGSPILGDFKV
jgi:hypothetical protein